jgi:VWFA-related protein
MRFYRLFLILLLLPLAAVWGQNSPPVQSVPAPPGSARKAAATPAAEDANRQITIDIQATDKTGAPIRGLQQQDFTVLDDKRQQSIVSFHAVDSANSSTSDATAEVVVVIDAVNAGFQLITTERNEIQKFLLQNGGKLAQPTSLVFFSAAGTKMQNGVSRDGNALAALYDQYASAMMPNNLSGTERFDLSIKTLSSLAAYEGKRPGRKLMIWISPGWPLLSAGNLELTPKDFQWLFNAIVELSRELRQAHITLYDVDPLGVSNSGGTRITYYQDFVKGVTAPKKVQPGNLSLQVLAVQSGGRVFNSTNDLTGAIANCAGDADSFYVLSFNSARADGPNEYHTLGVTVDKPDSTVRTRTGYYAQP